MIRSIRFDRQKFFIHLVFIDMINNISYNINTVYVCERKLLHLETLKNYSYVIYLGFCLCRFVPEILSNNKKIEDVTINKGGITMRRKAIGTCITAAVLLASMVTMLPVNAVSETDSETLITASETAVSEELLSFEELYTLEEDELKQYCLEHNLEYKSKEYAEERVASRPMT